jgi:hypothetical protein
MAYVTYGTYGEQVSLPQTMLFKWFIVVILIVRKRWSYRLSYRLTVSSGSLFTIYTAYKAATPKS